MPEIFLSYSSKDRAKAERFVNALEAYGLSVWWDQHIEAGERWASAIERNLDAAKLVVVIWSQHSTASSFCREEARRGLARDVLIQLRLDGVTPPLGFNESQIADLSAWNGMRSDPHLQRIIATLQKRLNEFTTVLLPEERQQLLQDRRQRALKTYDLRFAFGDFSVFVMEAEDIAGIEAAREVSDASCASDAAYLQFVLGMHFQPDIAPQTRIDDYNQNNPRAPVSTIEGYLQAITDRAVRSYREQYSID